MNISKSIKQMKEENNVTQQEIAIKTGLKQANLSRWENGERIPSIENCIILADFYSISIDELVGHEIKKNW